MKSDRSRKVLIRLVLLWSLSEKNVLFKSSWHLCNLDADVLCVFFPGRCSGCPYDAQVREVRDDSLVLLWAAPLYEGSGPVTGYLVEISEGEQSDCWMAVNEKPVCDTHYKVSQAVKRLQSRIRDKGINYSPRFITSHKQTMRFIPVSISESASSAKTKSALESLSLVLPSGQMFK